MPASASPVPGRRVYAKQELLALLVLLIAAASGWFFLSYVPRERNQAFESWCRDLGVRADVRRESFQRYFVDGLADAEVIASYPTLLGVLGRRSAAEGSAAHLDELFESFVRTHGVVGVVIWDAGGKFVAKSRDMAIEPACAAPAREVLASGSPATGFHIHEGFGPILTFSAPVRLPDGSVGGAVVIAEDPGRWLYPLLSQPLAGTASGESLLVARDGAEAVYLSPLRGIPDAPLRFRRPLDDPRFAARAVLDGSAPVGRFVDYRGVSVLAVGQRLPPSPWALVVKVDEEEAMAESRADIRRLGLALAALLLAVLGVAWGISQRRERVHMAAIARSEVRIRQLNRLLKTISEINQLIVHVDDKKTLLAEACRVLVEHGRFGIAWVGLVDSGAGRVVPAARAGAGAETLDEITVRYGEMPNGWGSMGAAIRTGQHAVVPDLAADPTIAPWREQILALGYRTTGAFPFRVRGEVAGALAVYGADPFVIGDEETTLLDELAGDIGYALGVFEIRDENRRVEAALRGSEERFRLAAETAADVIYEWDIGTRIQWFGNVDELMGYSPGEFPRTLDGWADLVHPEDRKRVSTAIDLQLKGEVPYDVEYRVKKRDGTYGYWWARGSVLRDAAGKPYRWVGSITDISDRKRAEGALRESESRFRQLADFLPQLVWTCQPDGPCDYLNRQWIEFTGVPEARQFGFGWLEQLHPDDRAPTVAAWEAAVASGENFRVEFRIRRHDGEYRWFDTQAVQLRDAEGHTVKWYGSNTDITERKRTSEALRTSEARMRSLFDGMLEGYALCEMVVDGDEAVDWVYLDVNPAFEKLTGLKDVVGKRATEVIPGLREENPELFEIYGRVASTGEPAIFEDRVPALKTWFAISAYSPGKGRFVAVFEDITERKRVESALRESESRFRGILENLQDAYFRADREGRFVLLGPAAPRMYGYDSVEEMSGISAECLYDNPEERRSVLDEIRRNGRVYDRVGHGRKKDGTRFWVSLNAHFVKDEQGRPTGTEGVIRDITDRKEAEEVVLRLNAELEDRVAERTRELESSNRDLAAANREAEAFSYSVSHDLRSPLRAVDGFSRILLADHSKQLDAEGRRLLDVVRTNTRQMGQLIDDLLSFSRIGRKEMAKSDVDMAALARAAFQELRAEGDDVTFTVGPLPQVRVDLSLMRQVWANLISNALKFTRPKANRIIEVGARGEPGRIVYRVKDNGVGFDMAYADKLFGVFQRLHSSHEFEGTGVGLALVQQIVQRHGGEVWAEGKVGEGATFSFSLPRPGGSP